ncbi:MAG: 1-acyl-sn-glycerol-3-phosphate acyltransferase [Proteobacteria bacterium]|nr:1-acyl-sn-glycerol-3-phosphate acyltransferase [Pseudomonadota bacterium]
MPQVSRLGKILGGPRALLLSVVVFAPLVMINFFQMLSILWKPFSLVLFRRYNSFWGHTYWTYMGWLARVLGGLRVELSGDILPARETALVIANHQTSVDTIVQLAVGEHYGRLGHMKFFVKDVLKYVPGPGWGMVLLECIFMKRNWTEDRDRVVRQLQRFKESRFPVWVNIYAEGTRLRPKKLAAARDFAKAQGMPLPERVLIPRVRGFLATLDGLEGHLQAVYDLTIAYPGKPPELWDLLSGRGTRVKVEIRRYSIKDLPSSQDARGAWLLQLFRDKDQRLLQLIASF